MKSKSLTLLLLIITIFCLQGLSQEKSSIQLAGERFPMLNVCNLAGEEMLCGRLEVFENRETLKGRKIPIDVIVAPAYNPKPPKIAFIYHPGGPGGSNKFMAGYFSRRGPVGSIRELRDVLMMDFRGTDSSEINCKAYENLYPYSYASVFDPKLVKSCLAEVKDKVDLSQYNTPNTVKDIEEVREWLGFDKLDFLGGSYGVRVALEYTRQHPKNINSIILSGTVSPNFGYVNILDKGVETELNRLIERCKNDEICNNNYPDFEKELYELRARSEKKPIKVVYPPKDKEKPHKIEIDGDTFRRMIGHLIMTGSNDEKIPLLVNQAYKGNFLLLINADNDKLVMPAFLSTFCPEEILRAKIDDDGREKLFTKGGIADEKLRACKAWTSLPEAKWLNEPIKGNHPVLIMSGENDIQTPPRLGEEITQMFPNNKHIIFPNEGHSFFGASFSCRNFLTYEFVKTGNAKNLDTECLEKLKSVSKPPFVIYISPEDFKIYEGEYFKDEITIRFYQRDGKFFMTDEIGEVEIEYLGDDTFNFSFCTSCRMKFEIKEDKITELKRTYQTTEIFKPGT